MASSRPPWQRRRCPSAIWCINGVDMKVAVGGYLQTLYDLKTEAVGGAMPGDGFYWMGA